MPIALVGVDSAKAVMQDETIFSWKLIPYQYKPSNDSVGSNNGNTQGSQVTTGFEMQPAGDLGTSASVPTSIKTYGTVIVYYGEIDAVTLDKETTGVDGSNMSLINPSGFFIDPCNAYGNGEDGDTSIIYLTIEYDKDSKEIIKRDIDWTDTNSPTVPDNEDNKKFYIIGEVILRVTEVESTDKDGNKSTERITSYEIKTQKITTNIYFDQAYYLQYEDDPQNGGSGMLNTFFVDVDKLQIYNQESSGAKPNISQLYADALVIGNTEAPSEDKDVGDANGDKIKANIYKGGAQIQGVSKGEDGGEESFNLLADSATKVARFSLEDGADSGNYFIAKLQTEDKVARTLISAAGGSQMSTAYCDAIQGFSHVTAYDDVGNSAQMRAQRETGGTTGRRQYDGTFLFLNSNECQVELANGKEEETGLPRKGLWISCQNVEEISLAAGNIEDGGNRLIIKGVNDRNIYLGDEFALGGTCSGGGLQMQGDNMSVCIEEQENKATMDKDGFLVKADIANTTIGANNTKITNGENQDNFISATVGDSSTTINMTGGGLGSEINLNLSGGGSYIEVTNTMGAYTKVSDGEVYVKGSGADAYSQLDPNGLTVKADNGNYSTVGPEIIQIVDLNGSGADIDSGGYSVHDASGSSASMGPGLIEITDLTGKVRIPVPGMDATWKEVTICVDGETKKMMVLGTDPY